MQATYPMSVSLTPALRKDYETKWRTCEIDYQPETVKAVARRILAVKQTCSGFWNIPWWFIALCWLRECNLNPKGCLHNGELIIGTDRKTKLVPAGRGPFATWHDATADALVIKSYHKVKDWGVAPVLFMFEGFNGFGYHNKGVPSPYLWSHTNHYADGSWDDDPKGGKYIRDHVWSGDVYDSQLGVCAVLKALIELDPTVTFGKSADIPPPPDVPPVTPEKPTDPVPQPAEHWLVRLLKLIFKR
jgi:lysozyme family protein